MRRLPLLLLYGALSVAEFLITMAKDWCEEKLKGKPKDDDNK